MSDGIADCGAAHAAAAAAAPPQFSPRNAEHVDAFGAQGGVGVVVAVVTDHHTGAQGQHVVAVIPLFAGLFERVRAAGGNELQRRMGAFQKVIKK